jgi:hypothetical protein
MAELYFHFQRRLHGIVFNYVIKYTDKYTLSLPLTQICLQTKTEHRIHSGSRITGWDTASQYSDDSVIGLILLKRED